MATSESKAFGYKSAWLAIKDRTPVEVMGALAITDAKRTSWDGGIAATYKFMTHDVFVTPPISGWVFIVGLFGLPRPARGDNGCISFVANLSAQLHTTVQYFITQRVVELHGWICATGGELTRAYAYVGESDEVLFDEGAVTEIERSLGVPTVRKPNEEAVMSIAAAWSLNPQTLDSMKGVEAEGWLGAVLEPSWTPQKCLERRDR